MNNPYMEEVIHKQGGERVPMFKLPDPDTFCVRQELVRKYAWAIPNEAAIRAIADLGSPVVEIGAGSGYWGWLLRGRGVTCHLYDIKLPGPCHDYGHLETWTAIERGGVERAACHPEAALMLCWPPYDDPMAREALSHYEGDTLIYIGEWGGCTADDLFHYVLDRDWEEITSVELPQFYGIHDHLWIYKRR